MLYWIWLTQISGVGPKRQRLLLDEFGSPENIYNATLEELLVCSGIGKSIAATITEEKSMEKAEAILDDINRLGIKLLTLDNPLYPYDAKCIEEMPVLLYYKGRIIENSMGVGIVGARRCTSYGKMVTNEVASYLAQERISVISGMAKGIDSYAHTSCLKSGGYTIAVLGNGLDICYPPEHISLMERIIENGAVISEYPPGIRPNPKHFPRRNLLISAWSYKILVVEAGERSGSLITADFGKRYNREIFAVPDNIYNTESMGSNKLIQDGAVIYLDKKQLLIDNTYENLEENQNNSFPGVNSEASLDQLEIQILEALGGETKTLEEISILININKMELLGKLSIMELDGKVSIRGSRVMS